MPTLVAIDISDNRAKLVTGETLPTGDISIIGFNEIELPSLDTDDEQIEALEQVNTEITPAPSMSSLVGVDVDAVLAIAPPEQILVENFSLQFKDEKKLAQVIPLQLQDLVPFDISGFIVDHKVIRSLDDGFDILASIIPAELVNGTLKSLNSISAHPKTLTTKASAIASFAPYLTEEQDGSFGILLFSNSTCSLALFINGKLTTLRELPFPDFASDSEQLINIVTNIKCSIANLEREWDTELSKVFLLGSSITPEWLSGALGLEVRTLDFSTFTNIDAALDIDNNDIAWALGLFLSEAAGNNDRKLVNFRKGEFAYKPAWGNFMAALQGERWYILLALMYGLMWAGAVIYSGYSELGAIESALAKEISSVMPGINVPKNREVEFFQEKLNTVENQLRSLGSLSSLSPLESIKELSLAVGNSADIKDIKIDALNIRDNGLNFRGSVLDFPSVGKLDSALESRTGKFCNVHVDPTSGAHRSQFKADVTFCK